MEFLNIFEEGKDFRDRVKALYEEAFPPVEKKPFSLMKALYKQGKMELLAIVQDGEFIGLAFHMLGKKAALLDYFAIAPEKRSGGYGSQAIRMLAQRFLDRKYILEIEMEDEAADNARERRRRKAFYLRNGLKETGIFANVYHTDFELLTADGDLEFSGYLELLQEVLGKAGIKLLNPALIEKQQA